MLNYIWLALVVVSVVLGGWNGHLNDVTNEAFNGAKNAVMGIALPLVGLWSVWLGIMRLAERSGLVQALARGLRPVLRVLFPDVPADHPAMGSIVLNVAANMLGLGNAATPLGLRAMGDLEKLNPHPGTATNAMCTFLAINTSSVQLIPIGAIAIMAAKGGKEPTAIVGSALLATTCACAMGIFAAKLLEKLPIFAPPGPGRPGGPPDAAPGLPASATAPDATTPEMPPLTGRRRLVVAAVIAAFAGFMVYVFVRAAFVGEPPAGVAVTQGQEPPFVRAIGAVSLLAIPLMLSFFPLYAALRGIKVYEEFVEGAKEGFQVALRIIPFLVAMLMAIGMLRGSGGMQMLTDGLRPVLDRIGFSADLLPMVLMRPLSGSGTQGLFADLVTHFGADTPIARTAGTIYGSTETTFYVIAVYFGSVAVRRTRHAIAAGLIADLTGVVASVVICRWMFGA